MKAPKGNEQDIELLIAKNRFAQRGKAAVATAAAFAGNAFAEVLWPTRCAVCDKPGAVLCERCARSLPFLDHWQACPRCGAPWGRIQCTECNALALKRKGLEQLPFAACVSAALFTRETGSIVRIYKDQGEQRLAKPMARAISNCIPPAWHIGAVTFVPASAQALRKRGFDHGLLLATQLAHILHLPCVATLQHPRTADQRGLSREERAGNLEEGFKAQHNASRTARTCTHILLVDDVYTTGATLASASIALTEAGFEQVYCATFARVY